MTDKKGLLAAHARASAQRVLPSVPRHFALGEEQASLESVAVESTSLSTLSESRRLPVRRSGKPRRLHLALVSTPLLRKKRRSSSPHEYMVITPVLEFANQSMAEPSESRGARSGWKRAECMENGNRCITSGTNRDRWAHPSISGEHRARVARRLSLRQPSGGVQGKTVR